MSFSTQDILDNATVGKRLSFDEGLSLFDAELEAGGTDDGVEGHGGQNGLRYPVQKG